MGKYEFKCGNTTFKGAFNIYQARSGAIMLAMGNKYITLSFEQITDLCINCLDLQDFNREDFIKFYPIIKEKLWIM